VRIPLSFLSITGSECNVENVGNYILSRKSDAGSNNIRAITINDITNNLTIGPTFTNEFTFYTTDSSNSVDASLKDLPVMFVVYI
jgi:hypothetical protein